MNAMIKPRAARPYIRGQALKERQAKTHAELREYVQVQKAMAEILERDPFKAYRAEFAHMNSISAGRAMTARIFQDTKDDLAFAKAIGEAVDDDMSLYAEWPELNDLEFFKTGGLT